MNFPAQLLKERKVGLSEHALTFETFFVKVFFHNYKGNVLYHYQFNVEGEIQSFNHTEAPVSAPQNV